jgi:hypothetical protein
MWKLREEINKTFSDHLDSLILSRMPFDEKGLRHEWSQALEEWDRAQAVLNGED